MKKYSENGLWIKQDGSEYVIGLSPKGQDDLGDVSFVELLKSKSVSPEDSIISVEAAKAVTELLTPLSGTVVAFHDELEENPEFLNELEEEKIDSMLDDRDEKPGFKFKDADLIGFPFKVVVGKRADEGIVELKIRRTGETLEVSENEVIAKIKELMKIY